MKTALKILSGILTLTLVGCNINNLNSKDINNEERMKGVWIATTENLDWPSKFPIDLKDNKEIKKFEDSEKEKLANDIKSVKDNNFNTVFFQVRPNGDALYYSKEVPFSELVSGTLGEKASYDPLKFAVKEAHSNGLKLEAWINPFRIKSSDEEITMEYIEKYLDALPEGSELKKNKEWIKVYKMQGGRYYAYLDPGIPEVREYVINVILEIVKNYDVDGIHIDDYFYPDNYSAADTYTGDNPYEMANDLELFRMYGSKFDNIGDFRRNNIDKFIKELNSRIKKEKDIKFGVSPKGIWKNKEGDGSNTSGYSSYYQSFADSKKWVDEEWIDYLIPQVYWDFANPYAGFKEVVDWWSDSFVNKDVNLYIGLAIYKIPTWKDEREIINQIQYLKNKENVDGEVLFRLKHVNENIDLINEGYNLSN